MKKSGNEITKILDYMSSTDDNGLVVITPPTGYGKTYGAIEYVKDLVDAKIKGKDKSNTGVIYLTPLVKNVKDAYSDLLDKYEDEDAKNQVKEYALLIPNSLDGFIEMWSARKGKDICEEVADCDLYRNLIWYLSRYYESNDYKEEEAQKKYSELRSLIKNQLSNEFQINQKNSTEEKLNYIQIENKNKWGWITDYFPAVRTSECPILFMSLYKFLSSNYSFIAPTRHFFSETFMKSRNWIVIMDEFDDCKLWMQKFLIENSIKRDVNVIDLFQKIHSSLANYEKLRAYEKNKTLFRTMARKAQLALDFAKLDNDYKIVCETTNDRAFLFDSTKSSVFVNGLEQGNKQRIENIDNVNYIYLNTKDVDERLPTFNLRQVHSRVNGFVDYFAKKVGLMVNIKASEDESHSYNSHFSTMVNQFRLNEYENYLFYRANYDANRLKVESPNKDRNFYNIGFDFITCKESESHYDVTKLFRYSYDLTPERILVNLCRECKVLGMSATALNQSPLCNFSLDYVQGIVSNKLNDSEEVRKLTTGIQESYEKLIDGYRKENVEVITNVIPVYEYNDREKLWSGLIGEIGLRNVLSYLEYKIEEETGTKPSNPRHRQYEENLYNLAYAFHSFLNDDVAQSMLAVVMSFHYLKVLLGKIDNDRSVMERILDKYKKEHDTKIGGVEDIIKELRGKDFEENFKMNKSKKTEILETLSKQEKGDKLFIVSCFATVSSGQNLKYKVPKSLKKELKVIAKMNGNKEKDIDSIYIGCPSHLIANIYDMTGETDKKEIDLQILTQSLIELEELSQEGALSINQKKNKLKEIINKYNHNYVAFKGEQINLYESPFAKRVGNKLLVQTLGRICRTFVKSRRITIILPERWKEKCDFNHLRQMKMKSPELISVIEAFEDNEEVLDIKNQKEDNENSALYYRISKYVSNYQGDEEKGRYWRPESMALWEYWREFVLLHPTLSQDEVEALKTELLSSKINPLIDAIVESEEYQKSDKMKDTGIDRQLQDFLWEEFKQFYYCSEDPIDRISYKVEDGERYEKVHIGKGLDFKQEVSADRAHLASLLSYNPFLEYANDRNIAKEFATKQYIMRPIVFNNIYKGALGESFGKVLLENELGIKLNNITSPDKFEHFDFVTDNGIYVDFKLWRKQWKDGESLDRHVSQKLQECGGKMAWIINCLTDESDERLTLKEKEDVYGICKSNVNPNIIKVSALYDTSEKCIMKGNLNTLATILKENSKDI